MRLLLARIALGLAILAGAACSVLAPGALPPGTPISTARGSFGGPTGEYALAGGGNRLEFAQGSFGRQTFMLDFDPAGALVRSQQVLTEANFANIVPGMPAEEVRMRLGRPANVFNVQWQKLQVWNYRYFGGDCVWFQVSLNDSGLVKEAGLGSDPACDGPSSRE